MLKRYLILGATILVGSVFVKVAWVDPAKGEDYVAILEFVYRPLIVAYLDIFGSPTSGILFSALIFFVLAYILFRYWFGLILPTLKMIDGIVSGIRAIPGSIGDPSALSEVRNIVHSCPLLADDWDSFETTFIRRRQGDVTLAQSPYRPENYFSLDSLRDRGVDLKNYLPYSGYFVAIGLVLTFMGLVAGLYFASRGMKTTDLDQARTSLIMLLNASTFKFATSIAGILSSVILSVVVRAGIQTVESRLHKLTKVIEYRVPLVTGEALIQDQINEIRAQMGSLRRIEGSLNTLVASQLLSPPPHV